MSASENNKRIAKNAIFLYIRMFFSLCISLYTSRVVLKVLGIEDFGIYNVVGGVVAMFSFLNASMSGATARFLAFEIGRHDVEKLKKTFSSSILVHGIIAIIVLILGETVGLWFLNTQLSIPLGRMNAAQIIYQFSLFSAIITVMQVPYNASIIANEKMDIYAYVEILNIILKLIIVWTLLLIPFDKLTTYSFLLLFVSLLIFMIYRFYCRKIFTESCRFSFVYDKNILRPMLSFSGWDLYGNASTLARTQGVNMLLNIFFGTVLNAASGIATQVQSAVMNFAGNVVSAFRPQIVKSYAQGEYDRMVSLVNNAIMYTTMLLLLFTIPLVVETDFVLTLWLGEYPKYASILCRYVLIFNLVANISFIVITGLHATGNIKRPSIINGSFYLSVIPVAYVGYKWGYPAEFAFIYNIVAVSCGMLSNVYSLHMNVPRFSIKIFFFKVLLKSLFIAGIVILPCVCISKVLEQGWIRLLYVTSCSSLLLLIILIVFVFTSKERHFLYSKLHLKK